MIRQKEMKMFEVKTVSIEWGGRTLTLETGRMARQADGAVLATYGDTQVLATAVGARSAKAGIDFFPLTVNYQEKFYAAGRIPGGYFKREGRPTEKETLVSRLIDRPIRPLFAKGFKNETQVVITTLSHDQENDPDVVAMVAASAALVLSGLPFMGPISAARVGYIDGQYILNPTVEQVKESDMDLVVAGTADAVMMVESEIYELSEEVVLGGVSFAHKEMQPVIGAIIDLAEQAAKEPWDFKAEDHSAENKLVSDMIGKDIDAAYRIADKGARQDAVGAAKARAEAALVASETNPTGMDGALFKTVCKEVESEIVRTAIVKEGRRIDGRPVDKVRAIVSEVGVLPRAHGSSLFTRGETQALVVATLGTADDEQFIDALDGNYKERFMLHYNFPPYSVGEVGRMGGAGRREIGHGKLAWRAMQAVLPSKEDFPYTMRLVSEITESNGSSSMASVCGASLALMDAGAPIKAPVAGVAMGLILQDDGSFEILTDILGDEDHLGDMDFKVAGTVNGITSLQMDIKVAGITEEIMKIALTRAHAGRNHILDEMGKAMTGARGELNAFAPKIVSFMIPTDKIREVIGTGGKVIREIVEKTGAKISIEDDGSVKVAAADQDKIDAAVKWVKSITDEAEVGKIYDGKVVKVMEFGAFVNFFGAKDGLVHISQLATHKVANVGDVVKEGDTVKVKLMGFDDRGKTRLSMKVVDQATGKDLEEKQKAERAAAGLPEETEQPRERSERSDRGDRPRRRRD
jgi:polyribonucleotide nucleotidyltransferase